MSPIFRPRPKQNFKAAYIRTYKQLGFPLRSTHAASENQITRAERKLGIELPKSLGDFYLVAGREKKLRGAFQGFRDLAELEIENGKLIFIDENQGAVVWSIDAATTSADPQVYQGPIVNDEVPRWYPECEHCSTFLVFMLHLQAAYGGAMPFTATAQVTANFATQLKTWNYAGEVNGMHAYSRPNQALCIAKWPEPGQKKTPWRAFAGAQTREALISIGLHLKLPSLQALRPLF